MLYYCKLQGSLLFFSQVSSGVFDIKHRKLPGDRWSDFTCKISTHRSCCVLKSVIWRDTNLTLGRTERCRPGANGSFYFSPWHREQTTSCRWGSRCRGPRAGQPPGYLRSGWEGSQSTTAACLARPAGSTSSMCSPESAQREGKKGQEGEEGRERDRMTEEKEEKQSGDRKREREEDGWQKIEMRWRDKREERVTPKSKSISHSCSTAGAQMRLDEASILDEVHLKANGTVAVQNSQHKAVGNIAFHRNMRLRQTVWKSVCVSARGREAQTDGKSLVCVCVCVC